MIENNRLIKLFLQMVKIDSESSYEDEFANFCKNYLKKLKFEVYEDNFGNIIAKRRSSKNQKYLLLSGHLDTVKPGKKINPIVKGDVIRSNGKTILGADNKLAIAIFFEAVRSLIQEKTEIRPLEIILTREEELGMVGARRLNCSKIHAKEGISLDAEGPIYHYTSSSPHAEIFQIIITGKAAHAGRPEEGIDALKIFSKAYAILKTGRIDKDSTLNFGLINGGEGGNTVIGKITSDGNVRSHDKNKLNKLKQDMEKDFIKIANNYKGKVNIKFTPVMRGYKYSQDHLVVQNLTKAISHKLYPKITNGGSDANIFYDCGIRVVELCHGAENTHTVNEKVSIKKMNDLLSIVKKIIIDY